MASARPLFSFYRRYDCRGNTGGSGRIVARRRCLHRIRRVVGHEWQRDNAGNVSRFVQELLRVGSARCLK